jgi:RING finger/CHY zinc finger protein 1
MLKNDQEQDPEKQHKLDRKLVQEVVCALCNTRQPKALSCCACRVTFGKYGCLKCSFYDDDITKEQFHCDECDLCRVGGRDKFFHCDTCNCCYSNELRGAHRCVTNSMHSNCFLCMEYLFDSVKPISVLRCGHTIHQECLRMLPRLDIYNCAICQKIYLSPEDAQERWNSMDAAVAAMPMPPECQAMQVNIVCNECLARSTVTFHMVGHKCHNCGGYNTQRI